MKIGLDFDGVIADTTDLKVKEAEDLFGIKLNPLRSKEYQVIQDHVMTQSQYRELMVRVCATESVGIEMTPVSGAIDAIKNLKASGNDLCIITSRSGQEVEVATKWLNQEGVTMPVHSVGYNTDKRSAAVKLGIQAYLDDDLSKLEPLIGVVENLYLFDSPLNQEAETPTDITRVTWSEFEESVAKIS